VRYPAVARVDPSSPIWQIVKIRFLHRLNAPRTGNADSSDPPHSLL
jgi:hypothetical protein